MKKTKLVTGLSSLATVAAITPIVATGCKSSNNDIKSETLTLDLSQIPSTLEPLTVQEFDLSALLNNINVELSSVTITSSDNNIATAKWENNKVIISSNQTGNVTLTFDVKDINGNKASATTSLEVSYLHQTLLVDLTNIPSKMDKDEIVVDKITVKSLYKGEGIEVDYDIVQATSSNPDIIDVSINEKYQGITLTKKAEVGSATIYIQVEDEDNNIGAATALVNIASSVDFVSYEDLVNLRKNNNLVPGQQYRITDYVATTNSTLTEVQSANNAFDIIVTATSKNTLNENASAIQHSTDETDYFAKNNLSAWELKYSLDNDSKFEWADTKNGKGVIYYMKDEFNNQCPYDFKNIQFKRYLITGLAQETTQVKPSKAVGFINRYYSPTTTLDGFVVDQTKFSWCYTFSESYILLTQRDNSLLAKNAVFNNTINEYSTTKPITKLNNIVIYGTECYSNTFDNNCYNNTLGGLKSCDNYFGAGCYKNIIGNSSAYNTFASSCFNNQFDDSFARNTFGVQCSSFSAAKAFSYNSFEGSCTKNYFGENFQNNTCNTSFTSNRIGSNCSSNSFSEACRNNDIGNNCSNNNFGNYCTSNMLGNNCNSNSFGNSCQNNKLHSYCQYNSFGNNCQNNIFGYHCEANSLSDDIDYISLAPQYWGDEVLVKNNSFVSGSKYINVNINNDELFNFANNTFISTAGTETSPISYSHECTYTTITNGLKHTSMTITDTSLPSQITSLAPVSGAISAKVDDTEIDWSKAEVTVKSYDSDIIDATWDANNKEVVFTPRFATGEATIFITVYDPDSGANGTISKTISVNISNSTVTYIDDNKELQTVEIDPNINPNEVFASHDLKGPSAEYPYKIPLIDGESKLTISDPNKFIELALTNISDEVDTISATNFLAGCTKLEKLSLNGLGNVKTITGDHFLTGCTSLKELDLSNLTSLEENGIQSQHFLYCLNNLKEVNFGDLKANIFDEASLGDTAYTLSVINSATVAITDGVYLKGSDQEELMKLLYNKKDGTGWFRYLRDSAPW